MVGWTDRILSFRRLAFAGNPLGLLSRDFAQGHLQVLGFLRRLTAGTGPNHLLINLHKYFIHQSSCQGFFFLLLRVYKYVSHTYLPIP